MKLITQNIANKTESFKDYPLLIIRLVLAYGFYGPATMKWSGINNVVSWFESMSYPLPKLSAYMAASIELLGVFLLFFGLGTRIISIPLMFIMLVAIFTVHLEGGFEAANNGFEIPLYYFMMLSVLFVYGPGKISIDYFFNKRR